MNTSNVRGEAESPRAVRLGKGSATPPAPPWAPLKEPPGPPELAPTCATVGFSAGPGRHWDWRDHDFNVNLREFPQWWYLENDHRVAEQFELGFSVRWSLATENMPWGRWLLLNGVTPDDYAVRLREDRRAPLRTGFYRWRAA